MIRVVKRSLRLYPMNSPYSNRRERHVTAAVVCLLFAVSSAPACRCGPVDDAQTQVAPAGAQPAPSSETVEPEGQPEAAEPNAPDELDQLEVQIAADLIAAIDADDPQATGDALGRLAHALGELRAGTYTQQLVHAVRYFCAGDHADLRSRVDARFVMAALEVMLDVRDGAAIDRLRQSYEGGVAGDRFVAASRLALSWSNTSSTVRHEGVGCDLTVNGLPARGDSTLVSFGSNTIACGDDPPTMFVATRLVHVVHPTPDGLRVADQ